MEASSRGEKAFEREDGKAPVIGVMMLETAFERPVGDIGNSATFGGRVIYEFVAGATADRIVRRDAPDPSLLSPFLAARDRLVARGAEIVTTSCGFLVASQRALQEGCPIPVCASSLLQIPKRTAELPAGRKVGVITIDGARLGPMHLAAAGAPADTPIRGVEGGCELARVILGNIAGGLDAAAAARDVMDAGMDLVRTCPEIGAIVLECTNMPPYRLDLARAVGVPVYDILTYLEEIGSRLARGAP
jgi:hypothetical protein